jgi:PAS domain S-box-containing protein
VQEEVDIWTKDGRRLRWLYRGSTLLDAESGRPLLTSMALDVTAQREAADELTSVADDLRQSNALLDAIFASAPVGLSFWDRDLRFRRVNPRLAEMNGLPESAHVGRRPDELMPGIADLEGILRLWREVIDERRTHTIEVRGTTPASPEDVRVWREHFFPVEIDGEVVGGSAVVEDVTARRLAEERLAAEEQRYRRIFEQTTTSTWELDLSDVRTALARLRADGVDELAAHFEAQPAALRTLLPLLHVRSVNPATLRLVGARSKEELASRLPLLLTDETWRSIGATFADLAEGRAEVRRETTLRTVDGREIHVLARARLPGPDERADQVLVSLLDVTALKDAEAVLREANQRKDEFLAMLAHELRNPLAPIRNAAEALRLARSEEPVVRWARDLIERQVQHLAHIVDDLLDVSRIVQGKVVLHRAPLDLRAVVRSAVETNRSAIDARGHALVLELPDMPLPVEGDFVRLTQVVGNLLTNAAKYTPEGGRITVTARADGGQVLLRVKDTGEGIARELLPQVFDLFTQAHRTIDRSQGGLGIGLTVVKRLVDMHGGEITAASEGPGRGAEFTMRLPRAASLPVVPADPPLPPPSSRASGPVRVLVVDDNVDAAESLAELLRLSGYAVKTAPDGGAALGVVESFRPEVALLDLGLPGMDGFELARRLRERPVTQGALLVAVTGYGREEDVRLAHDAGFDHHLVKPVDLPALRELLATAG